MSVPLSLCDLSKEPLFHLFTFLSAKEVTRLRAQCQYLKATVDEYLSHVKVLDFTEEAVAGYMSERIGDVQLRRILRKCPKVEVIYGLTPMSLGFTQKSQTLSLKSVIGALRQCKRLRAVQTNNLYLLEDILKFLPNVRIIGTVRNANISQPFEKISLTSYPRVTSLHLTRVVVHDLREMPDLKYLHLESVIFMDAQPLSRFSAPLLRSLSIMQCSHFLGTRFLELMRRLHLSSQLEHLEIARLMMSMEADDPAERVGSSLEPFKNLKSITFSESLGIHDIHVGYLVIGSAGSLLSLSIQPSVTIDRLFVSLLYSQVRLTALTRLQLGHFVEVCSSASPIPMLLDVLPLRELNRSPCYMTDTSVAMFPTLFPNLATLVIRDAPHLIDFGLWRSPRDEGFSSLTELVLDHCRCLQLTNFADFLSRLDQLESLVLIDMFQVPPRGCGHVGLSAGTGLGMTSAILSSEDEQVAEFRNFDLPLDWNLTGGQGGRDSTDDDSDDDVIFLASNLDSSRKCPVHERDPSLPSTSRKPTCTCYAYANTESSENPNQPPNLKRKREDCETSSPLNHNSIESSENDPENCRKVRPSRKLEPKPVRPMTRSETRNIALRTRSKGAAREVGLPSRRSNGGINNGDMPKGNARGPILYYHQSSQACSCDIRQNCRHPEEPRLGSGRSWTRRSVAIRKRRTRCVKPVDKCTNTSDPMLEEKEFHQTLKLVSRSVLSVSIIKCGISSINAVKCESLSHLEIQACPVLRKVSLPKQPRLTRLNVSECPHLPLVKLLKNDAEFQSHLLVSYEHCTGTTNLKLCDELTREDIERSLLSVFNCDRNLVVFIDYMHEADGNVQVEHRDKLLKWIGSYPHPILQSAASYDCNHNIFYPWGHSLRRIHGSYPNPTNSHEWRYEIITNNRTLAQHLEEIDWDNKSSPANTNMCGNISVPMPAIVAYYIPLIKALY